MLHYALNIGAEENVQQIANLEADLDEVKMEAAENMEKGLERARSQMELLHPSLDLGRLDSFKIVHNGELVDKS